mmetsp:Transcript_51505/g.110376  ORF Transcript_51505/g.110376 Transcript_51505/m.110376 type:complete len:484 (+) Transcript_51505:116-1567(+)
MISVASRHSTRNVRLVGRSATAAAEQEAEQNHGMSAKSIDEQLRVLQGWKLQRARVHLFLEYPESSTYALVWAVFILSMIVISIAQFLMQAEPGKWAAELHPERTVGYSLEVICTVIFVWEYVARVAVCDAFGGTKVAFITKPFTIMDLLAICPFFLDLLLPGGQETAIFKVLRVFRLVRLFRIFRLGRFAWGLRLMTTALANSFHALWVLIFWLGVGIVLFSSAVFFLERLDCPGSELGVEFMIDHVARCKKAGATWDPDHEHLLCCDMRGSPLEIESITKAMWWSMVTMCTVGFGDALPYTIQGRVVAYMSMICGILLIALPVAIVSSKFQDVYQTMEGPQDNDGIENPEPFEEAGNTQSKLGLPGRAKIFVPSKHAHRVKNSTKGAEVVDRLRRQKVDLTPEQRQQIRNMYHSFEICDCMEQEVTEMINQDAMRQRELQEHFICMVNMVQETQVEHGAALGALTDVAAILGGKSKTLRTM